MVVFQDDINAPCGGRSESEVGAVSRETNFQDRSIDDAIRLKNAAVAAAASSSSSWSPPHSQLQPSGSATSNLSSSSTGQVVHGPNDVTIMEDVNKVETTKALGSPTSGHVLTGDNLNGSPTLDTTVDGPSEGILDLKEFPLDSVFNENAIMLEALQSDIKAYSEQLGIVAQRLSDDTQKELATLKENLSRVVSHMNDLKINFEDKTNTIQVGFKIRFFSQFIESLNKLGCDGNLPVIDLVHFVDRSRIFDIDCNSAEGQQTRQIMSISHQQFRSCDRKASFFCGIKKIVLIIC